MLLMLSQHLTTIRNTTTSEVSVMFGQEVSYGLSSIPGENDEPYTDRLVVCVRRGKNFKAVSLSDALNSASVITEDSTGFAIHGYRVVHRTGHVLNEDSKQKWTQTRRLVHDTLDRIFHSCEALGYTNFTQDSLRIMDGNTLKNIPITLPILIMPFWDNGPTARSAIPAWDGHACVFRLHGLYDNPFRQIKYLAGVDHAIREAQTVTWLDRPGGKWKTGWYEDTQGMRWYSDIVSTETGNTFGLAPRFFDPSIKKELDCPIDSDCSITILSATWGPELTTVLHLTTETSITISNGQRFGLFYYRAGGLKVVICVYDFVALASNASVVLLLCRWLIALECHDPIIP